MPSQQDNRGGMPQGGQNTPNPRTDKPDTGVQDDRRPQSTPQSTPTPGQGKKQQQGTDTRRTDNDDDT